VTSLPIGARFVERMTAEELSRAARVDAILPALREAAPTADANGVFPRSHVALFRDAGLLGLVVPERYGGLGGGLRDLCAATYALATACPSTALCFFFHCSSSSRGLLALDALDAGLFEAGEAKRVRAFAEALLTKMGTGGVWLANFASESVKSESSAITIGTEAKRTEGGWRISGQKSFGCATGVADEYLVTAKLAGTDSAEGLATFFVGRDAPGVSERARWDALGMRGTATHGLILNDVFVPDADALAIPGAFARMMTQSRGSFVGNQVAGIACYLGAAQAAYDYALDYLRSTRFGDTGRPIAESPLHQQLIGQLAADLETAYLWLRRQLELETCEPPLYDKQRVVQQWRLCKGETAEACFRVAQTALKACGTGNTANRGPLARGLRDAAMGLVQAFPAERGRLDAAKMIVSGSGQSQFGVSE
jgi:alkylation response protein AidB-like acyl-CoA dehydrogenase